VFIGDSGTGKTHLVSALVVVACRQRKRARFVTAAALVNERVRRAGPERVASSRTRDLCAHAASASTLEPAPST
jgi:DNA replication protein DnaC